MFLSPMRSPCNFYPPSTPCQVIPTKRCCPLSLPDMGSLQDAHPHRVSVLFGPKCPKTDRSVLHIRRYLSSHRNTGWLEDAVQALPSVWHDVTKVWPAAEKIPGEAQLQQLSLFLRGGTILPDMSDPMNFLVVPITVLRHLVEFHEFKEAKNHYEINDIQGFCVGYLAAVAACWETDQTEFPKAVATMLRIAVCIGAVVDLDELEKQRATSMAVRWKTSADYKLLTALLSRYPGVSHVYSGVGFLSVY